MSNTRIIILIALSLVILGFVAILQVYTESTLGRIIYGNPFLPALLFFMFFGAFAGILKIFVDAVLPKRHSGDATKRWERTRAKGRASFVPKALLLAGTPILVALAADFANSDWSSYVVRNFVVLGVVLLGGIAAIANATWGYQDSLYLKARSKEAVTDEDNLCTTLAIQRRTE